MTVVSTEYRGKSIELDRFDLLILALTIAGLAAIYYSELVF